MTKIHFWQESLRRVSPLVKLTEGKRVASTAIGRENSCAIHTPFSPASEGLLGKRQARYYGLGYVFVSFCDSVLNSHVSFHVSP